MWTADLAPRKEKKQPHHPHAPPPSGSTRVPLEFDEDADDDDGDDVPYDGAFNCSCVDVSDDPVLAKKVGAAAGRAVDKAKAKRRAKAKRMSHLSVAAPALQAVDGAVLKPGVSVRFLTPEKVPAEKATVHAAAEEFEREYPVLQLAAPLIVAIVPRDWSAKPVRLVAPLSASGPARVRRVLHKKDDAAPWEELPADQIAQDSLTTVAISAPPHLAG